MSLASSFYTVSWCKAVSNFYTYLKLQLQGSEKGAGEDSELCKEAKFEPWTSPDVFASWKHSHTLPMIDMWVEMREINPERQRRLLSEKAQILKSQLK